GATPHFVRMAVRLRCSSGTIRAALDRAECSPRELPVVATHGRWSRRRDWPLQASDSRGKRETVEPEVRNFEWRGIERRRFARHERERPSCRGACRRLRRSRLGTDRVETQPDGENRWGEERRDTGWFRGPLRCPPRKLSHPAWPGE